MGSFTSKDSVWTCPSRVHDTEVNTAHTQSSSSTPPISQSSYRVLWSPISTLSPRCCPLNSPTISSSACLESRTREVVHRDPTLLVGCAIICHHLNHWARSLWTQFMRWCTLSSCWVHVHSSP